MLITAELLTHSQLFQRFPAVLLAVCPGWRRGELPAGVTLQVCRHPEPPGDQFTHPTLVRLRRGGTDACGLAVVEDRFQIFLEECFVVQTAVPAVASIGTGEGDVFPVFGIQSTS